MNTTKFTDDRKERLARLAVAFKSVGTAQSQTIKPMSAANELVNTVVSCLKDSVDPVARETALDVSEYDTFAAALDVPENFGVAANDAIKECVVQLLSRAYDRLFPQ